MTLKSMSLSFYKISFNSKEKHSPSDEGYGKLKPVMCKIKIQLWTDRWKNWKHEAEAWSLVGYFA